MMPGRAPAYVTALRHAPHPSLSHGGERENNGMTA